MASAKEDANDDEWEDVNMMMELPNGANLNVSKKDLYLQIAGLFSNEPVVKLDNMLYVGKVAQSLGSHLFIECKKEEGTKQAGRTTKNEPVTLLSDTYVKLEPVYLERKTGDSQDQISGQSSEDTDQR